MAITATPASSVDTPAWQRRFLATRLTLPEWARDRPSRAIYRSNATGVFEIYAWDRKTDVHRQLTARPKGTVEAIIDPTGEYVWWFNDTDGDELGGWVRQPFAANDRAAVTAIRGIPAGFSAGIALGVHTAVVGVANDSGVVIYVDSADDVDPASSGAPPRILYQHEQDATVGDLSADETIAVIAHSEHGDSLHPALRAYRISDGAVIAELADGPGKGLQPVAFCPVRGDNRLLVQHERRGRPELLLWEPETSAVRELALEIDGELTGHWYPDGQALLVIADHNARTTEFRFDLASGQLEQLAIPPGVIAAAYPRPDGTVEYNWSDATSPNQLRIAPSHVVLLKPGDGAIIAPPSRPIRDVWVDSPHGPIHTLIVTPDDDIAPRPTIFSIHGGPHALDQDNFDVWRAAYLDHGYTVVHVNYRGSTGYGTAWRDALIGNPGFTELADIAAVHDWILAHQIAVPDRCVLSGYSWGGYLTLLGLGAQSQRWCAGIAGVPIADFPASYEDEMESLKATDRVLFGSTPDANPVAWRRASPLTYVENVAAPVLILAGENDSRCPIRQVNNYLDRLRELRKPHELYTFDAGHGSLVTSERIRMVEAELDFLKRHVTD